MARNIRTGARLTVAQAARLATQEGHAEAAFSAGASRAVSRAAKTSKTAETTRETYLRHMQVDKMTITEIAKLYGVSRQSVHQMTTGYEVKRDQNRRQYEANRPRGSRRYKCSVCDELGHTAARHRGEVSGT